MTNSNLLYSAGSAAIVKTVKLQLLLANDYADDTCKIPLHFK